MQELDYEQMETVLTCMEIEQTTQMHDGTLVHICNAGTAESPVRYTVVAADNERVFISPPFFIN